MAPVAKPTRPTEARSRPRVLIVDDEPGLVEVVGDVVRGMDCDIVTAGTLAAAAQALAAGPVEVLVTDVNLPDGDGTTLLAALHRQNPGAQAVVITGSPTLANAVTALRQGAVDFVAKPFGIEQIGIHVRKALDLQARAARDARKFDRLRVAVRRLNEARRTISKKVDLLCNDLVSAYGELSRQLDGVRTQEGFRKAIAKSADLEQLLCHAMDWLLRQIGYSNVGIWLAGEEGDYQLGAYMKYTTPGDTTLTDAMRRVVLPATEPGAGPADTVIRLSGNDLIDRLKPEERPGFRGQDILAMNCTYLGESLAALVFFRDVKEPYSEDDELLLKSVAPVFAVALASIVRDSDESGESNADEDPDAAAGGDEPESRGGGDAPPDRDARDGRKGRAKRPDPADWWKRGEPPPF